MSGCNKARFHSQRNSQIYSKDNFALEIGIHLLYHLITQICRRKGCQIDILLQLCSNSFPPEPESLRAGLCGLRGLSGLRDGLLAKEGLKNFQ